MAEISIVQAEPKKPIYFPDLDGWRFVAFLAVFLFHAFYTDNESIRNETAYIVIKRLTVNGTLGVEFFFVLSGFLIIYLLIAEREQTGLIDIRKFYLRRVLRIFPLYYLCLFIGFVLLPYSRSYLGSQQYATPDWRYYIFFFSNFDGATEHLGPVEATLGVLWSVSIEEQFYLTVPFILLLVSLRWYPWLFISGIAVSLVFRALNLDNEILLSRHTLSFTGNLAIGGLAAYCSISSSRFVKYFKDLNPYVIKCFYVLIGVMFFFQGEIFALNSRMQIFQVPVMAALFGFIILEQVYSKNSFFKMRNNRVFSVLGRYTYGLYCLHVLAMAIGHMVVTKMSMNTTIWHIILIETPFNLGLALIIAYISYTFYEAPFLRLKAKFSFQQHETRS
jgi:peptidoglycan/LPS O-acetylase OafA/YrhL